MVGLEAHGAWRGMLPFGAVSPCGVPIPNFHFEHEL